MNKTNIEWTDYTWNPIKGICPMGCWYCYARKMYKRFKWNPEIRLVKRELETPYEIKKPSKIFVCSTFELFHPITKESDFINDCGGVESWRDAIFDTIEDNPRHTFIILTKFPQNIDRPIPDNVWLGVTIENHDETWRGFILGESIKAKIKFISLEPLLNYPGYPFFHKPDWIIIGRLTQHGKRHDPRKSWIERIVNYAKEDKIPIFLKDNLKEIWGEPLLQEFPK